VRIALKTLSNCPDSATLQGRNIGAPTWRPSGPIIGFAFSCAEEDLCESPALDRESLIVADRAASEKAHPVQPAAALDVI